MQQRNFLLLAAATLILVVLAGFSLSGGDRFVTPASAGRLAFPALGGELGQVARLRLSRGKMNAEFARTGKHWVLVEKGDYPADGAKLRRIVLGLAELSLIEPKTSRPALYSRLDVGEPAYGKSTLVAVEDGKGRTLAELIVGKRRYDRLGAGIDGLYVRKAGEARAWLARGSLDLSGDMISWLDRKILDIPDTRIASVTLNAPDGSSLVIIRTKAGADFTVAGAPAGAKFKSQTIIEEPATALEDLNLQDVKPAAELPVPASGVVTAAFTTFGGLTVHLQLFRQDKAQWVTIDASGNGRAAAEGKAIDARVKHWVYAIPDYKAQMLKTKLADLIAPPPKGS